MRPWRRRDHTASGRPGGHAGGGGVVVWCVFTVQVFGCRLSRTVPVRLHVIIWTIIHAHIHMSMFSWQLAGAFSRMFSFSFEAFGLLLGGLLGRVVIAHGFVCLLWALVACLCSRGASF